MAENQTPPPEGDAPASAATPDPAASDPPAPAAAPSPMEQLAAAQREKAELHDRLLRLAAEFENYKRRTRKEIDDAGNRGREALLKELLPVLDNLDRALTAVSSGGTVDALAQGVRLVEKQVHTTLEKFEVKRFEAMGQPFDPTRHEAIQQVETSETPPGTVAQVFARGYTIGERLLRPAMVAVAKAPPVEKQGNGSEPQPDPVH